MTQTFWQGRMRDIGNVVLRTCWPSAKPQGLAVLHSNQATEGRKLQVCSLSIAIWSIWAPRIMETRYWLSFEPCGDLPRKADACRALVPEMLT